MLTKVISGGQTGVDRAALDAAKSLAVPCGGWCPNGRRAEDGEIDERYSLQETPSAEYVQRTHWNIRDSDGTLILNQGELTSGTLETYKYALLTGKPVLLQDISRLRPDQVSRWVEENAISVLNVAGPRESKSPGIYDQARRFLLLLFPQLQ